MEWPSQSPDLNPIEHRWNYLGTQVAAFPPPRSLEELQQSLHPCLGFASHFVTSEEFVAGDDHNVLIAPILAKTFWSLLIAQKIQSGTLKIATQEGRKKLSEAVDTRRYPRAENRVWSDQEDHEERESKDRAASTCGPHSDSFNDTSRRRRSNCSQTISRHLAESNLKSKHPFRALPLTPEHRQLRLQWCQARSMWNSQIGKKLCLVMIPGFFLGQIDDNRVRVWRRPGERYNSPYTVLRHTARTAGVMVQRAIAYDSWSTLNVMRRTLTGQRYVDYILRPHVGPFLNGLPGAIFQQDNARPHTARVVQDFLRHFQTLPWPARSPDLSPVEHVWDQLKRQMPSCHSVHDLELAVQDLWAHLPQDNIRCLINSMPDRVAACIAAGGVVQRAIEVAQYLCRCTPCIRLIVLF
ncbi:transposable element Tc1 transposase [Trichonephila clavipes]|nr:transposable element Tc1 transposase [Trichonephila clavipes]